MAEFSVVGIGPGHPDYLLPLSLRAIKEADLLIGGERHLSLFSYLGKEEMILKGNYEAVFAYIQENYVNRKIAVLVSGDPGYHSLLGRISREFSTHEYRVYPGISSFQLAVSRIGGIWNDARLISLHGKKIEEVLQSFQGKLILLTDYKNTPKAIADFLIEKGCRGRVAYIAENLSYREERIRKMKLEEIKEEEYKLCVMIIE
jgi:cobalt-precorrin-7 (C5)-methyltransferase